MNKGLRIGSGAKLGGLGAFGIRGGGASDTTPPTVTITSTESNGTTVLPIPIIFTFSETVTGFAIGDITVGGGTAQNFAGSGAVYTCDIVPTANATVTVDVAQDVCVDAANNGNTAATQFSITSAAFTLADEFTDTVAAGGVNGTTATPTGGTRTAVDANSKISIGSGVLNFATGLAANNGVWYSQVARGAGKVLIFQVTETQAKPRMGWDSNQSGGPSDYLMFTTGGGTDIVLSSDFGAEFIVGNVATATPYTIASFMRATGHIWFIKGGAFSTWTLLYPAKSGTTALYPSITNGATTTIATHDYIRQPAVALTVTPIASDAFTRGDGALGNTGGGGSEESGGSGLAWASQLGTWGVATNKAASSALDGGASISIATVPCGTANVLAEVVATRAAGTSGLCLRYTDANNYIKAVHNGTNLQVIEVVAGTPNTLINAAATYGATARMIVSLNAGAVRAYYADVTIGTATTAVTTGNNHGLFTDDTGATFDNFVVWAKGIGSEYEAVFNKYLLNP